MSLFKNYQIANISAVSAQIIDLAKDYKIWTFTGEMGAGKTTLIKSICKNLGVIDEVNSPTFSLVNEYKTKNGEIIFHFDFYRIKSMHEAYDMGIEEYFESGNICLIEWPNMIDDILLNEKTFNIFISVDADTRS
ncbi:MAG: tRNA (adenosine(37)-N6)-threonylcarbamoyltransferase complex ATPase subunit type 1 TsaE, partial [Bacteroidia bacterium]|nr:tRNA (adenosine(37)-N6)-threonylcarbamoyltransferase complex ATPase subunit type 1 TsaE [Bacteroidia bacterium]